MAIRARLHHVVECFCGRILVELRNGQRVQRGLLPEVIVDHGWIGRLRLKEVVMNQDLIGPCVIGTAFNGVQDGLKLVVHGHHG